MPITVPTTKTVISTVPWGIPITNEVNALRAELDGLKPTAWTDVTTFINGWTNHGGTTHPVKFRKVGDVVEVRGTTAGGVLPSQIFTFPVGYRPVHDHGFVVYSLGTAIATVSIEANGVVTLQGGSYSGFLYLDPLRFSVTL
ncbi:MAG: hypothetical protein ABWY25_09360 [Paenisporosarcina sp.]